MGALPANAMSSVFREFEVEVRPEPPPPPAAPEERTAEDTLASQMDFGGEGAFTVDNQGTAMCFCFVRSAMVSYDRKF